MRTRYRRRRDALVDALTGFDIGITGLAAGVNVLLTLPDGSEHEVLRRAGEAGVAVQGLSRMRHPLAEIPNSDGIIVGFAAPAEHAFGPAVEAFLERQDYCGVVARGFIRRRGIQPSKAAPHNGGGRRPKPPGLNASAAFALPALSRLPSFERQNAGAIAGS